LGDSQEQPLENHANKTKQQRKGTNKMRMNYQEIKNDILDHWEQLAESAHYEDLVNELAESACPIYYSDILKDWQEMPSEWNDSWKENGIETNQETTIFSLMGWDLYFYYESLYNIAYTEIKEEKEEGKED
jgi:hypothetical protein